MCTQAHAGAAADPESEELRPTARAGSFGSGLVHMVSDAIGRLSRGSGGGGGGCMTSMPDAATSSGAGGGVANGVWPEAEALGSVRCSGSSSTPATV